MRSWIVRAAGVGLIAALASSCAAPRRTVLATSDAPFAEAALSRTSGPPPLSGAARNHEPTSEMANSVQTASFQASEPIAELPPGGAVAEPGAAVGAECLPGWNLAQLEEAALENHPGIAEAWARVRAARAKWLQVGLPPNPRTGYSGQQLGSRGQLEQEGVYIEQEIITARKRRRDRAVVCRQIQVAEHELTAQQQRVLTDVRISYYRVLAADQRLRLTKQLVEISSRAAAAVSALYESQEGSRQDWLQARVEQRTAENLSWQAEQAYAAAWRELAASVGWGDRSPEPLLGGIDEEEPHYVWEVVWSDLIARSPELAMARAEVERARQAIGRARAEAVPDLNVQGVVQHDNDMNGTNGQLVVTMPLPLFDRNQGGIRQAEAEWMASEQALQRLELELRRRLAESFERYATAAGEAKTFRAGILPDAEESLELTVRGYEAGELPYLELLTVQRTFFRAKLDYIDTLLRLWSAAAEIEGLLLTGSFR